ncbi:hypothetical protein predicted by Glimmer/Critica [Sorangium cellulosum So ce56]|uniref:Uncharacterized protein n=1 Tax=Sorangium cellulosum (strain So ce56) TaxID=448385 RepID=A9GTV7_SORC5|nr:hypothetical protein predicted by Glimmer/Critica [Sorangium cellulosum So ce56]
MRSRSLTPSDASRRATRWLTVERGSRGAFAAALKLPSCTTSTNVAIASKSNIVQPGRTGYSPAATWSSAAGEATVILDTATTGSEETQNSELG